MLGPAEMREVKLWLQTTRGARAQVVYWNKTSPQNRMNSEVVETSPEQAYTATFALAVEPGTLYSYDVMLNGKRVKPSVTQEFRSQFLWQHRSAPPEFSVALGSCAYDIEPALDRPGRPYGGGYEIFESIRGKKPNIMLWLGDNTYLRESDWGSRTGVLARYSFARALPQLQPLLAATHHYAIWDDHDYGPNDSDGSWVHKGTSLDAFKYFWPNPTYGLPGRGIGGITTTFAYGDAQFFLLDNRWNRTPNRKVTGERTMLGRAQLDWLIEALVSSRAKWKIVAVGGQVLNPAQVFETYANLFPQEREALLKTLADEKIPGVVFLTGDRHHTELTKMERPGLPPLYDLTVSPLTSGFRNVPGEANTLRVPETYVGARNFATLSFFGPTLARVMKIEVFSSAGVSLWAREIAATELEVPVP